MNNLLGLCQDKQKKLGRNLEKEEFEFLEWVYERYKEELYKEKESKENELIKK